MDGATLLPEFDQEMANTRKALERIPEGEMAFRPHEKSWTLREIAGHLAQLPGWTTVTLTTTDLDLEQPWEQPKFEDKAEILAVFDATVKEARAALEKASAADMMVPWSLRSGDQVAFTLPRVVVLRTFVLNHVIHHRGQLTVYLRLTGGSVPALYGPSADEQM